MKNKRADQVVKLQKQYKIKAVGANVPDLLDSFEKL